LKAIVDGWRQPGDVVFVHTHSTEYPDARVILSAIFPFAREWKAESKDPCKLIVAGTGARLLDPIVFSRVARSGGPGRFTAVTGADALGAKCFAKAGMMPWGKDRVF
jgi:hypothetical protein